MSEPNDPVASAPTDWHALEAGDVVRRLGSGVQGLTESEARARLEREGPNLLARAAPVPAWRILLDQFGSVVVLLLLIASVVALLLGDRLEALAIAAVLVINTAIGFVVELRARRAMDALLSYESAFARVRRDGSVVRLQAERLVPGDVFELEEGDAVPADGRLFETTGLRVDEAPLTGESLPVEKDGGASIPAETVLAERGTMVYSGTTVVGGRAVVVVTGTGPGSEIGRIGDLMASVEAGTTPLQAHLDELGRRLVVLTLAIAGVVTLLGVLRGAPLGLMLETGIALAIAAVPEGLPAVATIALAVGLRRMARRDALVRRLAAVEGLGATTVVCTDKTGTLTAGHMTVARIASVDESYAVTGEGFTTEGEFLLEDAEVSAPVGDWVQRSLEACALTTRASLGEDAQPVGDPTDISLLVLALKGGVDPEELIQRLPRVGEIPFETTLRLSASIHQRDGVSSIFVKGAPTAVMGACRRWAAISGDLPLDDEAAKALSQRNSEMASQGLRVIALASGVGSEPNDLTLLGLVGIVDPPAPGVAETIAKLRGAGIRTVMVTGDQQATAEAIAADLGARDEVGLSLDGHDLAVLDEAGLDEIIGSVDVLSRVTPEDKVDIVAALQRRGDVVAMLGDGVNDAPALKKADVGVAMGGRGTDVAKQAAAIVLVNDRFSTIGVAVEEGRVVYDNIRKFIFYLFSCNLAEIAVILGGSLAGTAAPLLPLQILWLNLVTDTFPALALAMEPAEPGVMDRPPKSPEQGILSKDFLRGIGFSALLITAVTLTAFLWTLGRGDPEKATTVAFVTLALAQLFHLGNARSRTAVLSPGRAFANRWALAALPLGLALQVAAVHWPPLARVLRTVPLGLEEWLMIALLAGTPAVVGQLLRLRASAEAQIRQA